jgi:hypothetical protein
MSYQDIYINSLHDNISHSLLSNLIENKILTIENVLNLSVEKIRKLKNIDDETVKEIINFQNWIKLKYEYSPEDIIPETKMEVLLKIDPKSELAKVEVEYISSLIKPILLKKLLKNNINTIGSICTLTKREFANFRSVGQTSLQLLEELIERLKSNPSIFINEYLKNTTIKVVPKIFIASNNIFDNFRAFIDSYTLENREESSVKHQRYFDLFIKFYGLNGCQKLDKVQTSTLFKLTNTRVEQILSEIEKDISAILSGNISRFTRMKINKDLREEVNKLTLEIREKQVVSQSKFHSIFFQGTPKKLINSYQGYLTVFQRINEFTLSRKYNSHLTLGQYIFLDKDIDKTSFITIAISIFKNLRGKVLPIKKVDLYEIIRRKIQNLDRNTFEASLKYLDNIEYLNVGKEEILQIEFSHLTSVGDMAERVLFERGKSTAINSLVDEVTNELNKRGISKSVTVDAVRHRFKNKAHIEYRGNTGIYSLKKWGENNETYKDLVIRAIRESGKPLFPREITKLVKEIRPEARTETVRVVTNQEFLALKNGKYILHEWRDKFQGLIKIKEKVERNKASKTRLQQVIEVFESIESKRILRKELDTILLAKYDMPFSSIRLTISKKEFFAKDKTSKGTYITYKAGTDYSGTGTFRRQIGNEIKVFFDNAPTKKVKLRNLVNTIVLKLDVPIDQVYRYINRNKIQYHKSIIEKVKYIELV